MAREPLPENGLISTNFVSSFGIPKKPKKGDKKSAIKEETPLFSKSSVKTNNGPKKYRVDKLCLFLIYSIFVLNLIIIMIRVLPLRKGGAFYYDLKYSNRIIVSVKK